MRIKSYFAPSVQSAIGLARKEFGDDVTLVTSHAASLESRHLGDYEVVFAVDEIAAQTESEPTPAVVSTVEPEVSKEFKSLLQEAIVAPPSMHEGLADKFEHLRSCFIEIGIEPPMVRALMTMVERCVPLSARELLPEVDTVPEPVVEEAAAVAVKAELIAPIKPRFTPAEMAFVLSVSV
jgi:hypothetical protein